MSAVRVDCSFCDRNDLDPEAETTHRQVIGWEHPRKQGGTNALSLRQPQEVFCCNPCMEKMRRGLSPDQQPLL